MGQGKRIPCPKVSSHGKEDKKEIANGSLHAREQPDIARSRNS